MQKYYSCRLSKKMVYDKKQLKESAKPLYGFSGKRIEHVGLITLLVSLLVFLSHRIIYKRTDANCTLHPIVFQGIESKGK
jgi:hypothetical protein